jgi:hypothetical protein
MGLRRSRRLRKRRTTVDLAVDAYVAWRRECVAVRDAYLTCRRARAAEAPRAFDAYEAALDREEVAANVYAQLIRRVGHVAELGLARELSYPVPAPGASS